MRHVNTWLEVSREVHEQEGPFAAGDVVRTDKYDVDISDVPAHDIADWAWLLRILEIKDTPHSEIAALKQFYYRELSPRLAAQHAEEIREVERAIAADRSKAEAALRISWGPEFEHTRKLLQSHIQKLPPAQREKIVSEVLPNGTLAMNDPETLERLARTVRGLDRPMKAEEVDAEIRSIEAQFGTKAYLKDEAKQARLRDLYRMRNAGK